MGFDFRNKIGFIPDCVVPSSPNPIFFTIFEAGMMQGESLAQHAKNHFA
jgi:hypothetical protein